MAEMTKPELFVTVYSDYICPFCYIGFVRLEGLRDSYDLKVNWCMLEIHPDNPAQGRPVTDLGYTQEQVDEFMGELGEMAREEGISLGSRTTTTNSHKALLLAEAAKESGREIFYALHRRLFEVYFSEGENIGDQDVLRRLAAETGVPPETVERAWSESKYEDRLRHNLATALSLGVTGTPTYFFGEKRIVGALPTEDLLHAARECAP